VPTLIFGPPSIHTLQCLTVPLPVENVACPFRDTDTAQINNNSRMYWWLYAVRQLRSYNICLVESACSKSCKLIWVSCMS